MKKIACPRCGKIGQVRDDYLGRSVKCKSCSSDFIAVALENRAPSSGPGPNKLAERASGEQPEVAAPKIVERLLCAVCRTEIDHPDPFVGRCPNCDKGPYGWRRIGRPGEVWRNTTSRMMYQIFPRFEMSCGTCAQYASEIGYCWPIPIHRGCQCIQRPIELGGLSLPFVYFVDEINKLDLEQQHALLGKCNWALFKSGLVTWSDVVLKTTMLEFTQVVALKRLTIPQMLQAGVPPDDAKAAWDAIHTPEQDAIRAKREAGLQKLRALGLSDEEIARAIAARLLGPIFRPRGSGDQDD